MVDSSTGPCMFRFLPLPPFPNLSLPVIPWYFSMCIPIQPPLYLLSVWAEREKDTISVRRDSYAIYVLELKGMPVSFLLYPSCRAMIASVLEFLFWEAFFLYIKIT